MYLKRPFTTPFPCRLHLLRPALPCPPAHIWTMNVREWSDAVLYIVETHSCFPLPHACTHPSCHSHSHSTRLTTLTLVRPHPSLSLPSPPPPPLKSFLTVITHCFTNTHPQTGTMEWQLPMMFYNVHHYCWVSSLISSLYLLVLMMSSMLSSSFLPPS